MHTLAIARPGLGRANILFVAIISAFLFLEAKAQTPATGIIEGRVLNVTSGAYLNNARVVVSGSKLETFTNATGDYRLTNVPAGRLRSWRCSPDCSRRRRRSP